MKIGEATFGEVIVGGILALILLFFVAWVFNLHKIPIKKEARTAEMYLVRDDIINLPKKNLNIGDAAIVIRTTPNAEVIMAFTYEKKCDEDTLGVTVVGGGCWVFRGFSEWFEEKEIK